MVRYVAPPGWPRQVRPPDAPDWERTAVGWLLDICPPEFRSYPVLRRHPVVLARFAILHVEGQQAAVRRGLSEARAVLRDVADPDTVQAAVDTWHAEAARLAAERRSDVDEAETGLLLDELSRARGNHGERRLIDLDQRLHRHVYRCAHNPFLEATLEEYYVLTLRIWFLALDRVERLDDAIREHHAILAAIRDRDPERAEQVMRAHVEGFERAIRAVL